MHEIMAEFILWTENPEINIDRISEKINLSPVNKEYLGDVKYVGGTKSIKRIVDASSLRYSTDYIDTIEVEVVMQKMIEMLKPNLNTIVSLINQYKLTAKFCVVIESSEHPIIFLPIFLKLWHNFRQKLNLICIWNLIRIIKEQPDFRFAP